MDRKADTTDDSPIKTVSSLRSAFEGLHRPSEQQSTPSTPAVASKPYDPISGPKPPISAIPSFKKQPPTPPVARRSLDVNRPSVSRKEGAPEDLGINRAQTRSPFRPRSPPKPRPLSMQVTPSKQADIGREKPLLACNTEEQKIGNLDDRSRRTNLPDKSYQLLQMKKAEDVSPNRVQGKTAPPAAQSLSVAPKDGLPSRMSSKQPPPPVNRAAKPGSDRIDLSSGATDVLRIDMPSRQPRTSPFSTPPGSEEGTGPILDAPPVPAASKPRAPTLTDPFATQTFEGNSKVAEPLRPSRTSSLTPKPDDDFKRQKQITRVANLNIEEPVPKLPPRREMSVSEMGSSRMSSPRAYERRSLEGPARRSALSQGFSASSYPPREDNNYARPNAPDRQLIAGNRRTSMTPPPRAKPESQFNKTFMKSSPVLAEPVALAASPAPAAGITTCTSSTQTNWPNSSKANRRPPCHREGPKMIQTGLDSRLMDACGDYVCTSGTITRVWHITSGKMLLSMAHPEGVKVTALAFKPSRKIDTEGEFVWLATNLGELMEVEVATRSVIAVNDRTHSRREVIRMYRKAAEMWTLDNDGKLFVWPSDESGTPSLEHSIFNGRASRGVTSSFIIGNKLWLAAGRSIRVFQPNVDPNKISFEVTTDPIVATSAGDITSSAYLPSDQDCVYFGHTDGKISIYSRKSNTHVKTLSVSLYKVSCLAGVGDYLWAGFNNGTIMLFDTKTRPWTTKKYWQPHTHPVVTIVADKSSIWKLGRYHVLSLGVDSMIGVWDGMLEDDWILEDMQRRESEFCTYKNITALVMTWNAGAAKPANLRHEKRDSNFFRELLDQDSTPDIIVFGFQELVDLEDKKLTAKNFFKNKKQDSYGHEHLSRVYREWRDHLTRCLDELMPQEEPYVQLHTSSLVGLFTCVFIKSTHRSRIRDLVGAEVKTGMGGAYGNKGSLIVRFVLDDTAICLANCHLAAGQTATIHRNQDVQTILGGETLPPGRRADGLSGTYVYGGDGSMVMDHEICILNGDLNYRIDTMGRDTVIQAIKSRNLQKLLDRDQLLLSRRKNPDFRLRDFEEASINFMPTYKYDVGTDNYDSSDKRRAPAWCDRILTRGDGAVEQLAYRRHEVKVSDHRPVSAGFKIRIKSRQTAAFEDVRLASEQRFLTAKKSIADESKTEYLKAIFGVSEQEARQLLRSR